MAKNNLREENSSLTPSFSQVSQVKEKIQEKYSHPTEAQRLIFAGKILDDDKTLESYNITEKEFLVLMVRKIVRHFILSFYLFFEQENLLLFLPIRPPRRLLLRLLPPLPVLLPPVLLLLPRRALRLLPPLLVLLLPLLLLPLLPLPVLLLLPPRLTLNLPLPRVPMMSEHCVLFVYSAVTHSDGLSIETRCSPDRAASLRK